MKKYINILLVLFLIVSCTSFSNHNENNNKLTALNTQEKINVNFIEEVTPPVVNLDTASLTKFWSSFQESIQSGNKEEVTSSLKFPIRAIFPVLLKFSHDCDTLDYSKNEEKYSNFDIDKNNINDYYEFVFTDVLKDMISQTTVENLLTKGDIYDDKSGLMYEFYPKKYNVKVNCPNDHLMMFYISYDEGGWKIGIGGL